MAVNFYMDKRTDSRGEAAIRVSVAIKGSRLLTSTGLKLAPEKWDAKKSRPKKGVSNASGLMWNDVIEKLNEIEGHFTTYERDAVMSGRNVTVEDLRLEFARVFRGKKSGAEDGAPRLFDCYNRFVVEQGRANQWTRGTYQKFDALKNHLQSWRKGLGFEDFTEQGLTAFVGYLRDSLDMKNSTIGKQLGFLKWFLRWATAKGYNENVAFQSFSPKLKQAERQVVFLVWEELMRVRDYEIPETGTVVRLTSHEGKEYEKRVMHAEGMEAARDVFCFCCFTGLRYSDANNLKRSDIKNGSITLTTIKTADTITIELNKHATAVLEKYKDVDFGGYALPRIVNQRMNMYLKELGELCGINEPVTMVYYKGSERIEETLPKYELMGTHTGRRTFICNALMLGIPAEIVMKWTGHSDYKSMKPYIGIANAAKAAAMKLFDKL